MREVADLIRAALAEYEEIFADETINKSDAMIPDSLKDRSYHVDEHRILRTQMSDVTIRAMTGRKPPFRLLAAGRTFRPGREDDSHLNVFHQVDGLCVDVGASVDMLKFTVQRVIQAALGSVELEWLPENLHWWTHCMSAAMTTKSGERLDLVGCGMIRAEELKARGFDPNKVSGFGFGMGLERLAMIRLGLDDVRRLWLPSYLCQK